MTKFLNRKIIKCIIVIIVLLGLLTLPIFKGESFYLKSYKFITQKMDYYNLSEERREAYDKMRIEHLNIKSRITGTAPFNTGSVSSSDGVDVADNDDYVRTFDVMKYNVELGISPNTEHSGVTPASVFQGGVIKVRAKLPNQGDITLMRWEQDAWMQNVKYSNDKTEIYAEYHVPSGVSVTNANQNLSFTVRVDGYKKEVTPEMAPEFEVWMEGNKPDDSTSGASSITQKDTRTTIISGHPSYDIALCKSNLNQNDKKDGQNGGYYSFSVGVALKQDVSTFGDLRGVEYPVGEFEINLELLYKYSDTHTNEGYKTIDANTEGAAGLANGTSLIAYSKNMDLSAPGFYPANKPHNHGYHLPAGKQGLGTASDKSVQDSGNISTSINDNKINIKFNNYVLNGIFPEFAAADYIVMGNNTGYFAVENIELFSPYYDDNSDIEYDYTVVVNVVDSKYSTLSAQNVTINSNNNGIIKDVTLNNNSIAFQMDKRVKGNFGVHLGTNLADYRTSDAYIYDGRVLTSWIQTDVNDGIYEGGSDNLLFWNPNIFEIIKYDSKNYYTISQFNKYGNPDYDTRDNVIQFGVYKAAPMEGLIDEKKMQAAVYEDFNWYSTIEEAAEHGKVTAFYLWFLNNRGNGIRYTFNNKFIAHVDSNDIGKTTMMFNKGRVYVDAEKTIAYKYGGTNYYNNDSIFKKTKYNENGAIISYDSPTQLGETFIMIGCTTKVSLISLDIDASGNIKSAYDVKDNNINLKITPTLTNGKTASANDQIIDVVTVRAIIPKGLTYSNRSANKEPKKVTVKSDGSTEITWEYNDWQVNHNAPEYPNITFAANISASLENNASLNISSTIYTAEDKRDEKKYRTSDYGVVISNLAGSKASKTIDKPVVEKNESFSITSNIGNNSEETLKNLKAIEILPRNNDDNGSKYSGIYTSKVISKIEGQKIF